ncbi:MAG: serine hydrolase [Saprospiraceae bacterium]
MNPCYLLFALLVSAAGISAQTFDQSKMEAFFDLLDAEEQAMGSIAIMQDGEQVYQRSIGYADVAAEQAADENTRYRIGSITKTFTATLILQLVEEGKLSLDTKLSKFFPRIPNAKKITVEQLLRHRSGIFNFTNAANYVEYMEQPKTRDELVDIIVAGGSIFPSDSTADYSNSGYVLLTYIAEKAAGKDYATLLQERICKPCALERTNYGGKIDASANEALSYKVAKGWEKDTETDMSIPAGAGSVVSTPGELTRFFNCLFAGKLLKVASLDAMTTLKDGFGLGLFQFPFGAKQAYGHTGGIDGFQSMAGYFPEDKLVIAYTGNGMKYGRNDIMIGALSIYFGRDFNFPEFTDALEIAPEELDRYVGTYSAPSFPLKIMVSRDDDKLTAQATGQSAFSLEAYDTHLFRFDPAGIKIEFVPADGKLILRQGGGEYTLERE